MYHCKAPLSRFYYPETWRIINAFIIIIKHDVRLKAEWQVQMRYI